MRFISKLFRRRKNNNSNPHWILWNCWIFQIQWALRHRSIEYRICKWQCGDYNWKRQSKWSMSRCWTLNCCHEKLPKTTVMKKRYRCIWCFNAIYSKQLFQAILQFSIRTIHKHCFESVFFWHCIDVLCNGAKPVVIADML